MNSSMLRGSILKSILIFMLPLFLGNLLQQLYNVFDAIIVGKFVGANGLAAISSTSSIQTMVIGFCIGVCGGFGVSFAIKYGSRDFNALRQSVFNASLIAIVVAVVATLLCLTNCDKILDMLKVDSVYRADARSYLMIIFIGLPCCIAYNLLATMLRSIGDSKAPFIFLSISVVVNIVVDLILVVILHLGCTGAAIATVSSQVISCICCLFYIIKKCEVFKFEAEDMRISTRMIKIHLSMGMAMGLQYSITSIGSMYMQAANNSLGPVYTTALASGHKLKSFMNALFDSLGTAVSVFCGQNIGAMKLKRVAIGVTFGIGLSAILGVLAGVIFNTYGEALSLLFIDKSETAIIAEAVRYLGCISPFCVIAGVLTTTRLSVQGIGHPVLAMIAGIIEMIARIAVVALLVPKIGYMGICYCDPAAWVACGIYISIVLVYCMVQERKKLPYRIAEFTAKPVRMVRYYLQV